MARSVRVFGMLTYVYKANRFSTVAVLYCLIPFKSKRLAGGQGGDDTISNPIAQNHADDDPGDDADLTLEKCSET